MNKWLQHIKCAGLFSSLFLTIFILTTCGQGGESGDKPKKKEEEQPSSEQKPAPELPLVDLKVSIESSPSKIFDQGEYAINCADTLAIPTLDQAELNIEIDGDLSEWRSNHFSGWFWDRAPSEQLAKNPRDVIELFRFVYSGQVDNRWKLALETRKEFNSGSQNYFLKFNRITTSNEEKWQLQESMQLKIENSRLFHRMDSKSQWEEFVGRDFTHAQSSGDKTVRSEISLNADFLASTLNSPFWSVEVYQVGPGGESVAKRVVMKGLDLFSSRYFKWKHCLSSKNEALMDTVMIFDARISEDFLNDSQYKIAQTMEWVLADANFMPLPQNQVLALLPPESLSDSLQPVRSTIHNFYGESFNIEFTQTHLSRLLSFQTSIAHSIANLACFTIGGVAEATCEKNMISNSILQNLVRRNLQYGDSTRVLRDISGDDVSRFVWFLGTKFPRFHHVVADYFLLNAHVRFLDYLKAGVPSQLASRIARGWIEKELEFDPDYVPQKLDDSDGDGIVDFEEDGKSLHKNNRDTDGDGYTDLAELASETLPQAYSSKPGKIVIDGMIEDWIRLAPKVILLEQSGNKEAVGCPENARILAHFFASGKDEIYFGLKTNSEKPGSNVVFRLEIKQESSNKNLLISSRIGQASLEIAGGEVKRSIDFLYKTHLFENEWSLSKNAYNSLLKFDLANSKVQFSSFFVEGNQEVFCSKTEWYSPFELNVLKAPIR